MRVDAARNRERILAAARELVAAEGTHVSMEAIANRAGVAVGTLYRHHPTKAELVAAVVDDGISRIAGLASATATRMRAGDDAWAELSSLMRAIADRYDEDKAVKSAAAALGASPSEPPRATDAAQRAEVALRAVVDLAHEAGVVRPDLTLEDLVLVLGGLPDGDAAQRARYLDIMLAGLTAPSPNDSE